MSIFLRRCVAVLTAVWLLLPFAGVQAAPDYLPVDQITKGMQGIAKTVVAGKTIEEFGIEVLDVMKQKGPAGDLILIRTYGDVIERTGGLAQGMSGSPVYIDGKLVGAIAYGWPLTDHKICMVTPIADMLQLWDIADKPAAPAADSQEPAAVPLAAPLMVSGFSDQALKLLADKLAPYQLVPYAVTNSLTDENNGIAYRNVEPGSSIGAQLVRGDVSVVALGTVTYVEDGKILAFGHPFLRRGNANYFLTDAYVYRTINSLQDSFKLGTATEAIGVINQDRSAGIAGKLGTFPRIIPLRIQVTDTSLGRSNELWAQVIQDEELAPNLAAVSIFNAIDKTTDRTGSGTARVSFEISANGIPGQLLKRENMFYTQGNIGELAIAEVHEALSLLNGNQFAAVDIMDVKVNVTIDTKRRTATIMEATTNQAAVKPGDSVDIAVKLKPFRCEPLTRHITYTVPKEQQPGTLMLSVRGGGMVSVAQLMAKQPAGEGDLTKLLSQARPKSLDEAVNELVNRDRNNDLVVEVLDMNVPEAAAAGEEKAQKPAAEKISPTPSPVPAVQAAAKAGQANNGKAAAKADDSQQKVHVTTDYIIDGETQLVLTIK